MSRDEAVVFSVSTDPEPDEIGVLLDGKCPIMQSYSGGPEPPDLPEVQRWMVRVLSKQLVATVGESLYFLWQGVVTVPEAGGCAVSHRSVQRPSRSSWSAASASSSNRPA